MHRQGFKPRVAVLCCREAVYQDARVFDMQERELSSLQQRMRNSRAQTAYTLQQQRQGCWIALEGLRTRHGRDTGQVEYAAS